ncbi:MAG: diguanylate cyclase, partial [Anaerolineae bacterium]
MRTTNRSVQSLRWLFVFLSAGFVFLILWFFTRSIVLDIPGGYRALELALLGGGVPLGLWLMLVRFERVVAERERALVVGAGSEDKRLAAAEVLLRAQADTNLEDFLEFVLDEVLRLTRFDEGSIHVVDPDGELGPKTDRFPWRRFSLSAGEKAERDGMVQSVLASGQSQYRTNLVPGRSGSINHEGQQGWRCIGAFPIGSEQGIAGVLQVASRALPQVPAEEIELIAAIAEYVGLGVHNLYRYGDLQDIRDKLNRLHTISVDIAGRLGQKDYLEHLVEGAVQLLEARAGALHWRKDGDEDLECKASHNPGGSMVGSRVKWGHGVLGTVAETGLADVISGQRRGDPGTEEVAGEGGGILGVAAPLKWQGETKGVIHVVWNPGEKHNIPLEQMLLGNFANSAAMAFNNSELYEELEQMATHDSLTGLYNRRHFFEDMDRYMALAQRQNGSMSLVLVDLDRFKYFNDSYGHPAGDKLLEELASILNAITRQADTVARYGGDEFALLLPDTSPEEAKDVGEKIRREVANHDFTVGKVSVSVGFASYPDDGREERAI